MAYSTEITGKDNQNRSIQVTFLPFGQTNILEDLRKNRLYNFEWIFYYQ